jgi:CheY-like chemotaxis protein
MSSENKSVKKVKILLVEDDSDHAEIFKRTMSSSPYADMIETHCLVDGEATLSFLKLTLIQDPSKLPNVIVLDINIPKIDGLGVMAQLKKHPILSSIPIVVLTTSSAPRDAQAAYALGASSFLVKPFDIVPFREMLHAFAAYWVRWNVYARAIEKSPALWTHA